VGGGCTFVNWAGAPVVATGTIPVAADGHYVTPSSSLTSAGCYSYDEELGATALSDPASGPAGIAPETMQLQSAVAAVGTVVGTGTGTTSAGNQVAATTSVPLLAMTGVELSALVALGLGALALGLALLFIGRLRNRRGT
jgi:hypothetical protein